MTEYIQHEIAPGAIIVNAEAFYRGPPMETKCYAILAVGTNRQTLVAHLNEFLSLLVTTLLMPMVALLDAGA